MSGLKLRVLGDLEVIRDEAVLDLPPSRKTRGLLAFLALHDRPMRREQLCELLWEIPDDPRGSLRWSLSKIRKLVDEEHAPRIIADRSAVAFDTSSVDIDVLALHRAAQQAETASVDELVRLAERAQGAFLEGLDLPDFHDFHAWCIGERERTIRSQARILSELGRRLASEPERALDYATALVSLTPFDESPRAELIRLLVQLDRQQEAEHQFRVGVEKLAELGVRESGALSGALKKTQRPPQRRPAATGPSTGAATCEQFLVGRESELELLRNLINSLSEVGLTRALLIRGEPGMGKSRLLQAAAAMAREAGAGLLKASAFETDIIRPFAVWNDALRRALPDNATSKLLASGDDVSRDAVFNSLVDVLKTETQKHPVVVLCDDVHWADESSLSAMHYVLRSNRRQPLLVIGTAREVELRDNLQVQQVLRGLRGENLVQEVTLQPMPSEQLQQLIEQVVPGADASTLAKECGGNPLLALELARAGAGSGSSLAQLVEERVARLDEGAATVLLWSAMLAPRISVHRLEQVTELSRDSIDDALEQAENQGILHPGERGLRFSHELVRKSVYELISPSRQRAMHRRLAELLEVDAGVDLDLAADLSHHARLSGDPYMAGKAMVSAGRLCLRFYANEDAMELYRQGVEFAHQLGDAQRTCLLLELGEIRMNALPAEDWKALADEFVDLAEQAMDHDSRSHARLGYQMASYLRWLHDELSGAKRFSLQAERVSRGGSDEAQVLGLAEAAKCLAMLERDLSRAEALVMEATALAQRAGISCAAIPASLGLLRYYEGRFNEAVDFLEDARTQSKTSGDRLNEYLANEYLTIVEMERRDCEAAYEHVCTLVAIGEKMREGSERPFAEALRALCHYGLTGEEGNLADALEELRMADAKQRLTFVLNRAAIQYLELGLPDRAHAFASEALELARVMDRPSEVLQAYLSLERVHRCDASLAPESSVEPIKQLAAGAVARWARERSDELLQEEP